MSTKAPKDWCMIAREQAAIGGHTEHGGRRNPWEEWRGQWILAWLRRESLERATGILLECGQFPAPWILLRDLKGQETIVLAADISTICLTEPDSSQIPSSEENEP